MRRGFENDPSLLTDTDEVYHHQQPSQPATSSLLPSVNDSSLDDLLSIGATPTPSFSQTQANFTVTGGSTHNDFSNITLPELTTPKTHQ